MPDEQRDFFISFNSANEAYAKAISDALRAEGFTPFFHPDDLEVGRYIPKWMNDALQNSHQMLALCSPEYMAEGAVYSEAERYAWFWRDTRGEKFRLVPVVLKEVEFPLLLAGYKRLIATNRTAAEAAAAVVAALKKPEKIKERQSLRGAQPNESVCQPAYVHTTLLPETGYKRLVGRDAELERLDKAWLDVKVNILSLIAEGGAGKSALVNEWLKRMQAHNYPGAERVLGWSFFSQGATERAASAEEFLNWALEKLGITLMTTSANIKADAIAEAMMRRRVLLLLDGIEPLQHGPGPLLGQLKDLGLRSLLRRFAATQPGAAHGLIVLTSRLTVKDLARWENGAAPVVDVDRLSDEAGAALLSDNDVRGTKRELEAAAHDFEGYPLGLGLLASFLKETQKGDVRRRDHIRDYLADKDNPRHDHAKRVMESYEKKWLIGQPALLATMRMVGLFDRPASGNCLNALRAEPTIKGLTDQIISLDDAEWQRAVTRLREVRLLAPLDPSAPDALDAHPLVREWFGEQLRMTNEEAWKAAHGRLYEHLRDTTNESNRPKLEELAPLYQAIGHGCRASRHEAALGEIYDRRICRRDAHGGMEFYASKILGATGNNLAAISWFFKKPYDSVLTTLEPSDQSWVIGQAAANLSAQGRFSESLPAQRAALRMDEAAEDWEAAMTSATHLSHAELLVGEIEAGIFSAAKSIKYADKTANEFDMMIARVCHANALHVSGRRADAEAIFADAAQRQRKLQPKYPLLYGPQGYEYCDLLISKGEWMAACEHGNTIEKWDAVFNSTMPINRGAHRLSLSRAYLGLALTDVRERSLAKLSPHAQTVKTLIEQALEDLRVAGRMDFVPYGLLARASFHRSVGDWDGAARDLDEVEEIAAPGPMRLFLCDMTLERARLAFAKIEAFAPLNGMLDKDNLPKPKVLDANKQDELKHEAQRWIGTAAAYIEKCRYHRRDDELAELQAVLAAEKTFSALIPRV
jgi:hypothetical protein